MQNQALLPINPKGEGLMNENKLCQNCVSRQDKIQKIISIEWAMFDLVNKGKSRASCQEDPDTFVVMRQSQFDAWSEELLDSYLADLLKADGQGLNLIELKYMYMMCGSNLGKLMDESGYPSMETRTLVNKIMNIMNAWTEQLMRTFPKLKYYSRPISSIADTPGSTSIETYQKCELFTYSLDTLKLFYDYILMLRKGGKNLPHMIIRNTALMLKEDQED